MKPLFRGALAAALSLLAATPALSVDDYTIQSGGASRKVRAKEIGGVLHPMSIAIDGVGLERFTTSNPGYVLFAPGTVIPISAATLPLPAGAATDAKVEAVRALLAAALTVNLPTGAATDAKLEAVRALLAGTLTVGLPSGAATASAQATANAALGAPTDTAWDGAAASASQPSILKAIWAKLTGLLTVDTVVRSTSTDRGGTIATAGTAQQFMAANAARRGVIYQNQSTGDLYVNCAGTAAPNQTSLKLPAGAIYESNPHHSGTGACSIYGATAGQAFFAREF